MGERKLRATGSRATETTTPGRYIVQCTNARIQDKGNKTQVVLTLVICEQGWNDGMVLKKWYSLPSGDGGVSPHSQYGRACALALGRATGPDEDLDPAPIFVGKCFEVDVGYRSNSLDGELDEANREARKDDKDFLRVHKLLRLVDNDEVGATIHMRSYGVKWPPKKE